jgi:hypothetical protein
MKSIYSLIVLVVVYLTSSASAVGIAVTRLDDLLLVDSTTTEFDVESEEKYFAIDAILDEGVEGDDMADSIRPYIKGLPLEYRKRIFKEHKRAAFQDGPNFASASNGFLYVPVIASIRQGDGVGIMTGLVGITSLVALASSHGSSEVSNASSYLGIAGVGLLVYTAIRATVVNRRNIEHNSALKNALQLPTDFSYSLTPTLRLLPNGSVMPALSLSVSLQ